ncbi:TPA: type IV pilus major pilin [Vibrio cholerae]|uniref:type IV pilus major pilin n=1 Tax=Vibrio cholerae TaxID=666 RepID=UPI0011D71C07|nr:type IV pilus major pilin [Vibrio cholerae]EGR2446850.1 type IV pilus major pilin [Vibrio cholerae]EGR4281078.1 type IV pilus major pilin [Vibrio cholerae]TYA79123.1 type IV pilus major pilin [Vibrio cholerae]GIB50832.1 toxin co-regulated pilin [Vibrio cholerae]
MKAFEFFSAKRQQFAQRAQAAFAQYKEAKKQRGMTLLEVIIVLGIIGTIAAGVVVLAQRAFDSRTISDLVQKTNTVRVAVKDVYSRSGVYPAVNASGTISLTNTSITEVAQKDIATAALVQLGKLSIDEVRNPISNDFMLIGGAKTTKDATVEKGFVIELNGLDQSQCRNIIQQVGNNWDYVAVGTAAAGAYSSSTGTDLSQAASGNVLRSLAAGGNITIDAAKVLTVCQTGASNSVILGSR